MSRLPFFEKGHRGNINFHSSSKDHSWVKLFIYLIFILLFFVILMLRLFQLTVVKGNYYRRLSEENRIKELIIEAKRGKLIDRKGYTVAENITGDIELNTDRIVSNRDYQEGEAIVPIIGYRQVADKNDIKQDNCLTKLKLGDKIGKKGVEKLFECQLRGISGKKLIEVDAHGKYLKTLSVLTPQDGKTIQLSFDFKLQKKTYELIKDKRGAVVALKPQTGEVLVLISSPSFDPQIFEDNKNKDINKYLTDKNDPLFNRASSGTYPAGSTFKPFMATAALEEKKIDEKTMFEDKGVISAGTQTFGNWYYLEKGKIEGMINIVDAIKRSNDIFFYKTGEALGVDLINKWAGKFGFGAKTNIGIDEQEGLVPSNFWKKEILKDNWYLGDTYNLSIGQGYLLVTPLQLARATATIANGGVLCKPTLLKYVRNGLDRSLPTDCQKLPISDKTLNIVKTGMLQACQPGGTGWPLFDFKPQVSCKTGTAESHAQSKIPHAWFTVYAPFDKPEIVMAILLEESGQGSDVAAPIAKEILKEYFERKE